jgi:two-component system, LytTR family, sensor kinase
MDTAFAVKAPAFPSADEASSKQMMKKKSWTKWVIIFGIAVFLGFIFACQSYFYLVMNHKPVVFWQVLYKDAAGRFFCVIFAPLVLMLIQRFRPEKYGWLRAVLIQIPAAFLFALCSLELLDTIGKPIYAAAGVVYPIGPFAPRIFARLVFYMVLLFVCSAIDHYQKYRDEKLAVSQLEAHLAVAQLDNMKINLSPDFLLTTLRSLSALIHKDIETADRMTVRLGDFLRSTLDGTTMRTVTLKRELDLLRSYLEIERLKSNDAIQVNIQTGSRTLEAQVPNRMIQTIIADVIHRKGAHLNSDLIDMHCTRKEQTLQIEIKVQAPELVDGILIEPSWLADIENRLKQLHGNRYTLTCEMIESGSVVAIQFPIHEEPAQAIIWQGRDSESRQANGILGHAKMHSPSDSQEQRKKRPIWLKWLLIAGIWTFIGSLYTLMDIGNAFRSGQKINWGEQAWSYLGWYFWAAFTPFVIWLVRKIPLREPKIIRKVAIHASASLVLVFLLASLYALVYSQTQVPVMGFYDSLKMVLGTLGFAFDLFIYWIIVAAGHSIEFYHSFQREKVHVAKLENQLATAQLHALQMQLHPHFLFNTLNSISELMHEDKMQADRMVAKLESFLLLTLASSNSHEVPLEKELEFLRHYLEIEQIRFQDRLTVQMNIEPATMNVRVPNLILQPLVENAIRHGISRQLTPGRLEIRTSLEEGMLHVQVRDNGKGLPAGAHMGKIHEGLGISNTRARLKQMYGSHQSLEMSNVLEGGFIVTMNIPTMQG